VNCPVPTTLSEFVILPHLNVLRESFQGVDRSRPWRTPRSVPLKIRDCSGLFAISQMRIVPHHLYLPINKGMDRGFFLGGWRNLSRECVAHITNRPSKTGS
jgi:hypothetical protein